MINLIKADEILSEYEFKQTLKVGCFMSYKAYEGTNVLTAAKIENYIAPFLYSGELMPLYDDLALSVINSEKSFDTNAGLVCVIVGGDVKRL